MFKKLIFSFICLTGFLESKGQNNIDMQNLSSLKPLVEVLEQKRVIALGNGANASKEFNQVSIEIIKELVQKKGYTLAFEANHWDVYKLSLMLEYNRGFQHSMYIALDPLWQSTELELFFYWLKRYNEQNTEKVQLVGLDTYDLSQVVMELEMDRIYMEFASDIDFLKQCTKELDKFLLKVHQNESYSALEYHNAIQLSKLIYKHMIELEQKIQGKDIKLVRVQKAAWQYLKNSFILIKDLPIDKDSVTKAELEAVVVVDWLLSQKDNKVIIWGFNSNIALRTLVNKPLGAYLKSSLQDNYYALSTLPSSGETWIKTKDTLDTLSPIVRREKYTLPLIEKDSWNKYFLTQDKDTFFIDLNKEDSSLISLQELDLYLSNPWKNGREYLHYSKIRLKDYFDGILFFKQTSVPDYMRIRPLR
ncbi:erythromycin esterase family protein [Myroides sp. LJL116]